MKVENTPNAGKLITSLRNTGYDSHAAIHDIIDNSIDAEAKNIAIEVKTDNKDIVIMIADNGFGMSDAVLDDALKLGSMYEKDHASDLGKYGMGLITASISMARRLEVITREDGGEYLYACQDLDEIKKEDRFVKTQGPATSNQIELFKTKVSSDTGTLVIISKVDRLTDTNISQFANTFAKKTAMVFRKFLIAGIKISVNSKELVADDPLMLSSADTEIFSDETYEYTLGKRKIPVRVMMTILPNLNQELEKDVKMNTRTQGFYAMRNNRQIASGFTLGLFMRHNSLNRFRAEISFDSDLDDEMGIRFTKDGISPSQSLLDFFERELGPQVKTIRKRLQQAITADKSRQVNHAQSADAIAKKAKLLLVPPSKIEKRKSPTNRVVNPDDVNENEEEKKNNQRLNLKNTRVAPSGIGARFDTVHLGPLGPLYDIDQQGKIIIIQWNADHPFYDRVVLANSSNPDIISAIDYLVFGFATAELRAANEDIEAAMQTIRSEMSTNLRALMS